ncbi:MAG: hypothetical protein EXX96DRAFT_557133 [Benjaminiella poitrasii]|nr:MAG: hypothetical protein EXX96DRAFT_557133 [Benjaminiella poitrasii]
MNERRPSLIDPASRTLYPISSLRHATTNTAITSSSSSSSSSSITTTSDFHLATNNNNSTHSSPSRSRRGSFTDPALHATSNTTSTSATTNLFRTSLLSSLTTITRESPPSSPSSRRSSMATTPENVALLPITPPSPWRRESLPSITYLTKRPLLMEGEERMIPEDGEDGLYHRRHSIALGHHSNHRNVRAAVNNSAPSSRRSSNSSSSHDPHVTTATMATTTPYSRSPELRVSHKLAERKRRKEMKDLFDDLRDLLPLDKGLKTSKWEILSKTLEYIRILHQRESMMEKEKEELLNELNLLKR